MEIRNAEIKDINKMTPLMLQVAQLHFNARKDIFKEKSINLIEIELKNRFEDNENILVAEDNENIVGILIYKIKEVEEHINLKDRKILWIDELVVDEKIRGKGIGKRLFNKASKIAKSQNCDAVELNCWNFNENAIRFYEKCGMIIQRRIMEIKVNV